MPLQIGLTATEREKLGVLVNNISIYGAQIITQNSAELIAKALSNLTKLKTEYEDLVRRVDEFARAQNEESPVRLIEDLGKVSADVAQMLTIVRRCLSACAFLGHLLAQPIDPQTGTEALKRETLLH